jgi:hypothetical protein
MRKIIKKLIRILDGTPQAYGKKEGGQSVVEIALVTPLLIIMLAGLVEIGWFARNYLQLMEGSRVGARRGATLQEEFSPTQWNENASLFHLAPNDHDPEYLTLPVGNYDQPGTQLYLQALRQNSRACPPRPDDTANFEPSQVGFYNLVLCQILDTLDPLEINLDNDIDDIVISVFSILVVDNRPITAGGDIDLASTFTIQNGEFDQTGHIAVVVGRWPTTANECNVWFPKAGGGSPVLFDGSNISAIYERDPFDYYDQVNVGNSYGVNVEDVFGDHDNNPSTPNIRVGTYPLELADFDPTLINNRGEMGAWVSPGWDDYRSADIRNREMVRGFAYTGQRRVYGITRFFGGVEYELQCWGSDKDVAWVQERLNNDGFVLSTAEIDAMRSGPGGPNFCRDGDGTYCDQREFLPNNGIVLVEIYWQHQLLLQDMPVFSPVYNFLNDEQTTIEVWAAFPTVTVIPEVRYTVDPAEFID